MAVRVGVVQREAGDHHVRLELPEDPDDIGQHLVVVPEAQRLLGRLGEAEIDGAGEELPPAVDAPRRQQLLRADEAQKIADLGTDQVLSAVAARHREVTRVRQPPLAEVGDEAGVLVVRVGGHVEHARQDAQLLQRQLDLGRVGPGRRLRQSRSGPGPQGDSRHDARGRHTHPPLHAPHASRPSRRPSRTCL
jgi:hypothetical protein